MPKFNPIATYRIQFNKDFTFSDAEKIIPYLSSLNIDTLYASPIFTAVPGSNHGYDGTNPLQINPEIGTEAELFNLSDALKAHNISWIQDIVPNHMAFHPYNDWLMDVLENGFSSPYIHYFDLELRPNEKLMVPFLGTSLDEAIETGKLNIQFSDGKYRLFDGNAYWPLCPETLKSHDLTKFEDINSAPSIIREILSEQNYRLCHWQETENQINYRRFFTVNGLICLNIQLPDVYDWYHQYIFELVEKEVFQGLRIDHIDGLASPTDYLNHLRNSVGADVYIVAEKILAANEELPLYWPIEGSTGYEFLATVNNVMTRKKSLPDFDFAYRDYTGKRQQPEEKKIEKKQSILNNQMNGEQQNLSEKLIGCGFPVLKHMTQAEIKNAIAELLVAMPVYRFYDIIFPLQGNAKTEMETLLQSMDFSGNSAVSTNFWKTLLFEFPKHATADDCKRLSDFFQRLMQFSGPVMAKGVEDTLMYSYNRFIGHTEVGDDAEAFGIDIDTFHAKMVERAKNTPLAMNATSTHDTKKGEDVRAKLNALSDVPQLWKTTLNAIDDWYKLDKSYQAIHLNDFYLLLQAAIGAMPFEACEMENLPSRLGDFMEKALREGKKRSEWSDPDVEYEQIIKEFVIRLLDDAKDAEHPIAKITKRLKDFSILNSLHQLLLKTTCPGIPDFYQGTECFDLSFVDPDNRRPVDFEKRKDMLQHAEEENSTFSTLWNTRENAEIKVWLTQKLLGIRKDYPELFSKGEYLPLPVEGEFSSQMLAYLRHLDGQYLLIVVPLGMASILENYKHNEEVDWGNTQIVLPVSVPKGWKDLIHEEEGHQDILHRGLKINSLLKKAPFGIFLLEKINPERKSGVLMHLSSLPGKFPIGDMGKEAFDFVDFLAHAEQSYWQILPITPVQRNLGYSPYSGNSAFAGNILLISPALLLEDNLLSTENFPPGTEYDEMVNLEHAEKWKISILNHAFLRFLQLDKSNFLHQEYQYFMENEKLWLDDFSLFSTLKDHFDGKSWTDWPEEFKKRNSSALLEFQLQHQLDIDRYRWQQFIFYRQWFSLKNYANRQGIKIIGDLPFYIDQDAVEVWCKPEYFKLKADLKPEYVAGVPPDYFNEKGQLWGMPVYDWTKLAGNSYDWWIQRIQRSLQLFDELRLDHFRAFLGYYQVNANDKDATNGEWQPGPGDSFFDELSRKLPHFNLIAEDLGEITPDVRKTMKKYNLPGMKVLQFAFGDDMVSSEHILHADLFSSSFVYAATHDNNTVKGWFDTEANEESKARFSLYTGKEITSGNAAFEMIRLCLASNAKVAIIQMQDILAKGEESRMNIPGEASGNWTWRMLKKDLAEENFNHFKLLTQMYGRGK